MMKKIFFLTSVFLCFCIDSKPALASSCSVAVSCPIPQRNCNAVITNFVPNVTYKLSIDEEFKTHQRSPSNPNAEFIIVFANDSPTIGQHNLLVGTEGPPLDACGVSFNDNRTHIIPTKIIDFDTIRKQVFPSTSLPGKADLTLADIISAIIPYIYVLAGLVLFGMLLMGGFSYLTSAGDPEKMKAAQGKITHAVIGFLIIFLAYWLAQLLEIIFGIQIF